MYPSVSVSEAKRTRRSPNEKAHLVRVRILRVRTGLSSSGLR